MLKVFKFSEYLKLDRIPLVGLILLELCAIILAVMMGFWMNQWRENRNDQKIVESAKYSLAAELNHNHERMIAIFDYYDLILSGIEDTIRKNPDLDFAKTFGYQIPHFRGAMPPLLRSASYQMLLTSGILKDFDFQQADLLSVMYNYQSVIEKMDDAMIVGFADDSGLTRISNIRHKFGLYNELIPMVLAFYRVIGQGILGDYGYEYHVESEKLQKLIDLQGV